MQGQTLISVPEVGGTRLGNLLSIQEAPEVQSIVEADAYHRCAYLNRLFNDEGEVVSRVRTPSLGVATAVDPCTVGIRRS
jgi:hypothetical protein